jgi:DNA-binding protein Fis
LEDKVEKEKDLQVLCAGVPVVTVHLNAFDDGGLINLDLVLDRVEKALVREAYLRTGENKAQTGILLDLGRTNLVEKFRRWGWLTPIGRGKRGSALPVDEPNDVNPQ